MQSMKLNQQQNSVRVVTFNFAESPDQVYSLQLLMSTDQAQKHVRRNVYIHNILITPISSIYIL